MRSTVHLYLIPTPDTYTYTYTCRTTYLLIPNKKKTRKRSYPHSTAAAQRGGVRRLRVGGAPAGHPADGGRRRGGRALPPLLEVQCSTVQYSIVWYSTVWYSTVSSRRPESEGPGTVAIPAGGAPAPGSSQSLTSATACLDAADGRFQSLIWYMICCYATLYHNML